MKNYKVCGNSENLSFDGYVGTWYVVDEKMFSSGIVYALESELCGDEAPWMLVDSNGEILDDNAWNGLDDYMEVE